MLDSLNKVAEYCKIVNVAKFLRTPFLQNNSVGCLCWYEIYQVALKPKIHYINNTIMTLMQSQSPQKFWQEQSHHHKSEVVARRCSAKIMF